MGRKTYHSFFFKWIIIFLISGNFLEAAAPKLLIKFPTRGRFEQFFNTLDLYYKQLSKIVPYEFVISCDLNDPVMNSEEAITKLNTYPHLSYHFSDNHSKIEACNQDMDFYDDYAVILLASDDMIPIKKGFDLVIMSAMKTHFPNYDGVLHFNDGYQGNHLNTLCIMGKNYYKQFGYIYHPDYKSFYCDAEFTQVSYMLNKAKYEDIILIEHRHPANGKAENDLVYLRNQNHIAADAETYFERQANFFDLSPDEILEFAF